MSVESSGRQADEARMAETEGERTKERRKSLRNQQLKKRWK